MTRRTFLSQALVATAAASVPSLLPAQAKVTVALSSLPSPTPYRTKLQKALIRGRLSADEAQKIVASGFKGVELSDKSVTVAEAREALKIAQDAGINIHSFMGGWFEFNSANAVTRKQSIEQAKRNIEIAKAYGASVMLVVPGRIGGEMPKPSQFDLTFDPQTLELKKATAQGGFAAYVKAQNDATKYAQDAIGELMSVAADHGVILGLENVWNNLWVKPDFAAAFIRSFKSPWVKAYLDLGNHARYATTEEWLMALSDQIVKLHIKDFKINRAVQNEGMFVRLGEGSINWKSVRKVIDTVGYNGWISIEENGWTDPQYSEIMDRFFAGTF